MEKSLTQLNALLSKNKALILVLPWVLYALYLVLWAAPQYESHSQLIVKSSDGGSSFDPSSLLMAAGVSGASGGTESQLVEAYIQSADMIKYLDETIGLREHYMSDKADMFSGLSSSHKQEDFYKFYLDHIEVSDFLLSRSRRRHRRLHAGCRQ